MMADGWKDLCEQLPRYASPSELDDALAQFAMLDQDERAALWLFAPGRDASATTKRVAVRSSDRAARRNRREVFVM